MNVISNVSHIYTTLDQVVDFTHRVLLPQTDCLIISAIVFTSCQIIKVKHSIPSDLRITPQPSSSQIYDVLVVGAGVVGCAVARRFALQGARVIVVDKAGDILEGASKGNSAILHTGFDAPHNSVELDCIREGYEELREIHSRLNLPIVESGAIVTAWNEAEVMRLDDIINNAHKNGVKDVKLMTTEDVRQRVSTIGSGVLAAVSVPGESLVDPWSTPLAYLLQAQAHDATFLNYCEVKSGLFEGERWRLTTTRGDLHAHWVVNCAGLHGDSLNRELVGHSPFKIYPRKGQFIVYDKSASKLTNTILLPVPSATTKGVVVCPTVFGNLLVGPTAEDQESREDASVDSSTLKKLKSVGERILPELRNHDVTAVYAGIRPATDSKDYQIYCEREKHYLCMGGIRSTGLSAALGIAQKAFRVICEDSHTFNPPKSIHWPQVPQISEAGVRDWMLNNNGGIICHCELVTRREIQTVLQEQPPVTTLSGLKRRTRVTMGRCQGFYCSAQLSEITEGYLQPPMDASIG